MKKMKPLFSNVIIIIIIAAFSVSAAEVKNTSDSTAPAAVKAAPSVAPTPVKQLASLAPAPVLADTYSYNPSGKPDPFKPFIVIDVIALKQQIVKKAEASIFPLQRAGTETYKIVGIAGDGDRRVAICEDAAKKFYPLFKGTHIGLYNGKVIEIMADRVIVEEYETNNATRVILKLRKN